MYPWLNFALAQAPPHRPPLCLNMDETALIRHPTGLRGYVAKVSGPNCIAADKSSLADRRCYMTYLACVADDPSIQPKLPQVLLGNEHQLTLETMRSIADDLPRSIMVWRQKTSWNSKATMRRWLTVLATALGDVVKEGYRYVILLVDETILQHARRCGIRLVYIPAKMTAYLQPCETHVFAKFEHAFRKLWRERRSLSPDGAISMRAWMQVVSVPSNKFLHGRAGERLLFQMGCWRGNRGCLHGYVLCWSLMMLLICRVSHHLQRKLCAYSPNA